MCSTRHRHHTDPNPWSQSTYTEAYDQPYKTTFLVTQFKIYAVISTNLLINSIRTLYVIDIY